MESLRKGLSGMDAARAAMGQGCPFAACPWSNDGAREPAAGGPDARGKTFWLLLGQLPKVTRRKGGTVRSGCHLNQCFFTSLRRLLHLMSDVNDCAGTMYSRQTPPVTEPQLQPRPTHPRWVLLRSTHLNSCI